MIRKLLATTCNMVIDYIALFCIFCKTPVLSQTIINPAVTDDCQVILVFWNIVANLGKTGKIGKFMVRFHKEHCHFLIRKPAFDIIFPPKSGSQAVSVRTGMSEHTDAFCIANQRFQNLFHFFAFLFFVSLFFVSLFFVFFIMIVLIYRFSYGACFIFLFYFVD